MLTRREFLRRSAAASATTTFLARGQAAADGEHAKRPNIVLIMTDQQFADAMSCVMGDKYIRTPAMDSLAETGTRFSRAYSPNPLCMPARGSIFTGRYPHEMGINSNQRVKLDTDEFVSMGTYFRRAGYETGYFGKWHLSMNTKDIDAHGFETFGEARPGGKNDDVTGPAAAKWIAGRHAKPFLAVVSFLGPHDVCQLSRDQRLPCGPIGDPPPPDQCPPVPANLAPPADETDTMTVLREAYHAPGTLFPVGDFSADKWRQFRWGYYRIIEEVDKHVAQVLDALSKAGLDQDTVVVFVSDHGDCAGAHRFNQKTVFYEESARVPMIIRWKGETPKAVCDRLVNTGLDILPTMMDFAGIEKPDRLTGLSLKALALGKQPKTWRDHVVVQNDMVQTGRINGVRPTVAGRMVRTDRYKYCIYDTGRRREALFDMRADPLEATNLAGRAEHRQTVLAHREILAAYAERQADKAARDMLADGVPAREFDKKLVDGVERIIAARAAKSDK